MATRTYMSGFAHSSDATFRAWVAEFISELLACGAVQTADTGQINPVTVTRPGINTSAGYIIIRFSDALQATYPVFIKIEFGTGSSAAFPAVWVTAGTGTNGAGTLTGTLTTRATCYINVAIGTPTTRLYMTNICVKDGYVMVAHKRGYTNAVQNNDCAAFFLVGRTTDDAGALNGDGLWMLTSNGASTPPLAHCIGFAASYVPTASIYYSLDFGALSNTFAAGSYQFQLYKCVGAFPAVRPVPWVLQYRNTEAPENAIIPNIAPIGAVSYSYLPLGQGLNCFGSRASGASCGAVVFD